MQRDEKEIKHSSKQDAKEKPRRMLLESAKNISINLSDFKNDEMPIRLTKHLKVIRASVAELKRFSTGDDDAHILDDEGFDHGFVIYDEQNLENQKIYFTDGKPNLLSYDNHFFLIVLPEGILHATIEKENPSIDIEFELTYQFYTGRNSTLEVQANVHDPYVIIRQISTRILPYEEVWMYHGMIQWLRCEEIWLYDISSRRLFDLANKDSNISASSEDFTAYLLTSNKLLYINDFGKPRVSIETCRFDRTSDLLTKKEQVISTLSSGRILISPSGQYCATYNEETPGFFEYGGFLDQTLGGQKPYRNYKNPICRFWNIKQDKWINVLEFRIEGREKSFLESRFASNGCFYYSYGYYSYISNSYKRPMMEVDIATKSFREVVPSEIKAIELLEAKSNIPLSQTHWLKGLPKALDEKIVNGAVNEKNHWFDLLLYLIADLGQFSLDLIKLIGSFYGHPANFKIFDCFPLRVRDVMWGTLETLDYDLVKPESAQQIQALVHFSLLYTSGKTLAECRAILTAQYGVIPLFSSEKRLPKAIENVFNQMEKTKFYRAARPGAA